MLKLSIIIPVYNVEKYVEKCLRSCAEQDLSPADYEIIVLNDGTQDKSLEIAELVTREYSNIIIYSQKNAGLSAARNRGLSLAKGQYVWFVDSDDWLKENCLNNVMKNVKGLDALAMGYVQAYDDEMKNRVVHYSNLKFSRGKDLLKSNFFPQAQLYVFRRAFLVDNSLSFYEGIFHEDSEFTPRMLYFADKLKILKQPFYYFYKRPNSISTTPSPQRGFDCIKVAISLSRFANSISDEYKLKFNNLISTTINNSLFISNNMDKEQKKKLNAFIFKNRFLFNHLLGSSKKKYRLEGVVFKLFPEQTTLAYQVIQVFNLKRGN